MKYSLEELCKKLPNNAIIIMCGLPATGKSTVAKMIADERGYELLRSDILRAKLLEGEDIFDSKIASDMNKRLMVYEVMFKKASEYASSGKGVILDATFVTQSLRERAATVAHSLGRTFVIIETVCDKEIALSRIRKRREGQQYESNAITEEAYNNNLKIFEPVKVKEIAKKFPELKIYYFVINTDKKHPVVEEKERWNIKE